MSLELCDCLMTLPAAALAVAASADGVGASPCASSPDSASNPEPYVMYFNRRSLPWRLW